MSLSLSNSLAKANKLAGYTFYGGYAEVLPYSQVIVRINTTSATNSYILSVYYSNNKTTSLVVNSTEYTNQMVTVVNSGPQGAYVKIQLELLEDANNLSIDTMFKSTTIYDVTTASLGSVSVSGGNIIVDSVTASVDVTGDFWQATQPVSIAESVSVSGQEPQPRFYATPATNTAAVYADGDQGVNVNGGWLYSNTGSGHKINWYVYANTVDQASTAKKIKDIKDMYMVIYHQYTAVADVKNPFIAFYSLNDAGTNTSWYKNRYVFDNFSSRASEVGSKLLYIGEDNPLIHPEILIRIELNFDPVRSTATLAAGAEEDLWLSSVQTTSSALAGEYNFVFSEFGINFNDNALQATVLPIIDNKVQVAIANDVAVTGTFWQATQPVSIAADVPVTGTFYQVTQPVSIAADVPVTGTFYPATQPVSIATTIDTNIADIDTDVTFQCQERATTESFFTTGVSSMGISASGLTGTTLRNFSFNTTSAVLVYIMLYDTGLFPVAGDTPKFVFPIQNSNNVIFNNFDHRFVDGLGIRAVTTYAAGGSGNPAANSVFINMTMSD